MSRLPSRSPAVDWLIVASLLTTLLVTIRPVTAAEGAEASPRYVAEARLPKSPETIWNFFPDERTVPLGDGNVRVDIPDLNGPVSHEGIVYVSDRAGRLYAVAAKTGGLVWKRDYDQDKFSAPAIDGERLFVSTAAGLLAVSAKDGQELWRQTIRFGASACAPVVAGDAVYVAADDGHLYAFEQAAGRQLWTHDFISDAPQELPAHCGDEFSPARARLGDKPARPRGVATDGDIVLANIFDQSRVIAVDAQTGQRRWSLQTCGWVGPPPAITAEHVFIISQDKHCYCVHKADGTLVWKFATRAWMSSTPVVHEGAVYINSNDGGLYRVNLSTGEQDWRFIVDADYKGLRHIYSTPLVTDGAIYFAAGEGQTYAVNLADGKLLWKHRPSTDSQIYCSPATDGQRLFVTTRPNWDDKGEIGLFAIGEAAKEAEAEKPQFRLPSRQSTSSSPAGPGRPARAGAGGRGGGGL